HRRTSGRSNVRRLSERATPGVQPRFKVSLLASELRVSGKISQLVWIVRHVVQLLVAAVVPVELPLPGADGANRIHPFLLGIVFEKYGIARVFLPRQVEARHRGWPFQPSQRSERGREVRLRDQVVACFRLKPSGRGNYQRDSDQRLI